VTRLSRFWHENGLTLVVAALLAIAFFSLRSTETDFGSADQLIERLDDGSPTALYIYSNT